MKYFFSVAAIIFSVVMFVFIQSNKEENFPFRCSGFTHYEINDSKNETIEFFVSQDLRFQSKEEGYLLFNGKVTDKDREFILSRTLVLNNGKKLDTETYRYQISGIKKSQTDSSLPGQFEQLINEFTSDPSIIDLDVINLEGKTYLLGGPVSYLSSCIRY